jgi:hypothetical protein
VKKITLQAWAAARYDPPPGPRTVQRWARLGELSPAPVKVGRCYYINPNAVRISEVLAGGDGPSLVEQLEARR